MQWSDYRVVRGLSQQERAALGDLRRRAYAAVGKASLDAPPMLDALDDAAHVVHLLWSRDDRLIAAVRIVLPERADDPFDMDHEVDLGGCVPDRRLVGEASRLIVDPSLHRSRCLLALSTATAYEIAVRGRVWGLICADERLAPFYVALGCRDLRRPFSHASLGGVAHRTMLGNVRAAVQGRLVAQPLLWSLVFAPAASALLREPAFCATLRPAERVALSSRCAVVAAVEPITRRWLTRREDTRPRRSA